MATYVDLTVPVKDILGLNYIPAKTGVYISANTPNGLIIVDGAELRIGGRREKPGNDGAVVFTNLVATDSADNPTLFEYQVTFTFTPIGAKTQQTLTTSTFPLTADANLAAIDEAWDDITAPPSWRSDFLDSVAASATAAAASATSAAASAALADSYIVADLNTSDGQMEALIESPSSLTATALSATYGTRTLLNIKDYGAVCDGTTNDTLAIRAAVAAVTTLRASGFARPSGILIPHGTTRIEVNGAGAAAGTTEGWTTKFAVVIPSDFIVAGEGPTSVVKMTGAPATAYGGANHNSMFGVATNGKNVVFRDFTVVGENGTLGSGFTAVDNNDSAAIDFGSGTITDCLVQNVTFKNLYGFSVHDRGENLRIHVKDCTTLYCANGINANASYSHFTGNTILNSEGVECSGAGSVIAHNTIKDGLNGAAISAGGNYTVDNKVPGTIVAFNTIDGVAGSGISLADSFHHGTVIGNTIRKTALQGIIAANSGSGHLVGDIVIAHNTVVSAGASGGSPADRSGIYVATSSPVMITGNMVIDGGIAGYDTFYGCLISGYGTPGPAGTIVTGNKFRGSDTDIRVAGSYATDVDLRNNDAPVQTFADGATRHRQNFTVVGQAATTGTPARASGTDVAGTVQYETWGSSGNLFTVTFAKPFRTTPIVTLTPTDNRQVNARIYAYPTTTGFEVKCLDAHAAGVLYLPFTAVEQ